MSLSIALLHHPMRDKRGDVVTTSITNLDIHDLSRSATTFGVSRYFIVHPVATQRAFAERIARHWIEGWGASYNETRREAFQALRILPDLSAVVAHLEAENPGAPPPVLIATHTRPLPRQIDFPTLRRRLREEPATPFCLLFGTGWGYHPCVYEDLDYILEPVYGPGEWNHLSVRAAAAIILDRLLGRENS